jgi:Na+-driven multidrug efflux pump
VAYVNIPTISIPIATSILGAQAIGAGRADRLNAIVRTAMLFNLLFTGVLVALGYLLSHQLIGLFITSASVIEIAQILMYIMLWSLIIFGMAGVLSGIMRASGTVLVPALIVIGCIALVELPTAWIASRQIGLNGVWIGYPAAFGAMLLLHWVYYQWNWRKRAIKRLV